jgi:GcrA cell cycle regulator
MSASSSANWDADTITKLRYLWTEGHSTAEIGRRLGISKNAVVGKAHRLELPARPSPIGRGGTNSPRPARRPACPPLAQLMPLEAPLPTSPARVFSRPGPATIALPRDDMPCCWPIGEPSRPSFHFCGADNVAGKPYCPEHCGLAYRKPRRARERDVPDSIDHASSQAAGGGAG